jgi:hypothetical protein
VNEWANGWLHDRPPRSQESVGFFGSLAILKHGSFELCQVHLAVVMPWFCCVPVALPPLSGRPAMPVCCCPAAILMLSLPLRNSPLKISQAKVETAPHFDSLLRGQSLAIASYVAAIR